MSTLTDRIRPWTNWTTPHKYQVREPRPDPFSDPWALCQPPHQSISISIIDDPYRNQYNWLAIRGANFLACGGPHPTRHDATVDAMEHVPDWNIIRTL